MARTIVCDAGDGEPALFMFTHIPDGSTAALCDLHFVAFALEIVESHAGPQGDPDTDPEPAAAAPETPGEGVGATPASPAVQGAAGGVDGVEWPMTEHTVPRGRAAAAKRRKAEEGE